MVTQRYPLMGRYNHSKAGHPTIIPKTDFNLIGRDSNPFRSVLSDEYQNYSGRSKEGLPIWKPTTQSTSLVVLKNMNVENNSLIKESCVFRSSWHVHKNIVINIKKDTRISFPYHHLPIQDWTLQRWIISTLTKITVVNEELTQELPEI